MQLEQLVDEMDRSVEQEEEKVLNVLDIRLTEVSLGTLHSAGTAFQRQLARFLLKESINFARHLFSRFFKSSKIREN